MGLLGRDQTDGHAHHPHRGGELEAEGLGQVDEPCLRRAVDRCVRRGTQAAHARDVHDHPTLGLVLHHRECPLREDERRDQVQRDDRGRELRRHGGGVRRRGPPRVVHQDVQTTEALPRERHHGINLVGIPNVRRDKHRAAITRSRERVRLVATADDNVGSGGEEPLGDPATDTATPTGDDHHSTGEIETVMRSFVGHDPDGS